MGANEDLIKLAQSKPEYVPTVYEAVAGPNIGKKYLAKTREQDADFNSEEKRSFFKPVALNGVADVPVTGPATGKVLSNDALAPTPEIPAAAAAPAGKGEGAWARALRPDSKAYAEGGEEQRQVDEYMRFMRGSEELSPVYVPLSRNALRAEDPRDGGPRTEYRQITGENVVNRISAAWRDATLVSPSSIYYDPSDEEVKAHIEAKGGVVNPLAVMKLKDENWRMARAQAMHEVRAIYRASEITEKSPSYVQKALALSRFAKPLEVLGKGVGATKSGGMLMPAVRAISDLDDRRAKEDARNLRRSENPNAPIDADLAGREAEWRRRGLELDIQQEDRAAARYGLFDVAGRFVGGLGSGGFSGAMSRGMDSVLKTGEAAAKGSRGFLDTYARAAVSGGAANAIQSVVEDGMSNLDRMHADMGEGMLPAEEIGKRAVISFGMGAVGQSVLSTPRIFSNNLRNAPNGTGTMMKDVERPIYRTLPDGTKEEVPGSAHETRLFGGLSDTEESRRFMQDALAKNVSAGGSEQAAYNEMLDIGTREFGESVDAAEVGLNQRKDDFAGGFLNERFNNDATISDAASRLVKSGADHLRTLPVKQQAFARQLIDRIKTVVTANRERGKKEIGTAIDLERGAAEGRSIGPDFTPADRREAQSTYREGYRAEGDHLVSLQPLIDKADGLWRKLYFTDGTGILPGKDGKEIEAMKRVLFDEVTMPRDEAERRVGELFGVIETEDESVVKAVMARQVDARDFHILEQRFAELAQVGEDGQPRPQIAEVGSVLPKLRAEFFKLLDEVKLRAAREMRETEDLKTALGAPSMRTEDDAASGLNGGDPIRVLKDEEAIVKSLVSMLNDSSLEGDVATRRQVLAGWIGKWAPDIGKDYAAVAVETKLGKELAAFGINAENVRESELTDKLAGMMRSRSGVKDIDASMGLSRANSAFGLTAKEAEAVRRNASQQDILSILGVDVPHAASEAHRKVIANAYEKTIRDKRTRRMLVNKLSPSKALDVHEYGKGIDSADKMLTPLLGPPASSKGGWRSVNKNSDIDFYGELDNADLTMTRLATPENDLGLSWRDGKGNSAQGQFRKALSMAVDSYHVNGSSTAQGKELEAIMDAHPEFMEAVYAWKRERAYQQLVSRAKGSVRAVVTSSGLSVYERAFADTVAVRLDSLLGKGQKGQWTVRGREFMTPAGAPSDYALATTRAFTSAFSGGSSAEDSPDSPYKMTGGKAVDFLTKLVRAADASKARKKAQ